MHSKTQGHLLISSMSSCSKAESWEVEVILNKGPWLNHTNENFQREKGVQNLGYEISKMISR